MWAEAACTVVLFHVCPLLTISGYIMLTVSRLSQLVWALFGRSCAQSVSSCHFDPHFLTPSSADWLIQGSLLSSICNRSMVVCTHTQHCLVHAAALESQLFSACSLRRMSKHRWLGHFPLLHHFSFPPSPMFNIHPSPQQLPNTHQCMMPVMHWQGGERWAVVRTEAEGIRAFFFCVDSTVQYWDRIKLQVQILFYRMIEIWKLLMYCTKEFYPLIDAHRLSCLASPWSSAWILILTSRAATFIYILSKQKNMS